MAERKHLFRSEAVVFKSAQQPGKTLLYLPRALRIASTFLVVVFIAALIVAGTMNYKTTVPVRGGLALLDGTVKVYPSTAGRIQELLVSEGQAVKKGDVLAIVSTSQYDVNGASKINVELEQINKDSDFWQQQLVYENSLFDEKKKQQTLLTKGIGNTLRVLHKEKLTLNEQLRISSQNNDAQQALLGKRLISKLQFNQQYSALLATQEKLQALEFRDSNLTNQYLESQGRGTATQLEYEKRVLEIDNQLQQLSYHQQRLKLKEEHTLLATADGYVTAVMSVSGESTDPRQPIMYINSVDSTLTAQLYVSSNAIGNVQMEQTVLLSYDAFPAQSFSTYQARISSISKTSINPREHLLPISELSGPVYLVEATLEQQYVEGPDTYPLQPGMLFGAEIVIKEMTLLNYIFEPIRSLKRKT